MSRFSFEQDENGPFFWMSMELGEGQERMRFDWESATLFSHSDIYRHLDHVFIETDRVDEQTDLGRVQALGAFIWRQTLEDFDDLANAMITHDFPHIHMPHPNPMDLNNYISTGLTPPEKEVKEVKVIEEVEDDEVVAKKTEQLDHELNWFLNDPHYYDRIKPRKNDE